MRAVSVHTNLERPEDAAYDLVSQFSERSDFRPNVLFFYSSMKYYRNYSRILKILRDEYGNIPQIGCVVDGFVVGDRIWTDGAAMLGMHHRGKVEVVAERRRGVTKTVEAIAKKIKDREYTALLVHYPLVYVPSRRRIIGFLAMAKLYDRLLSGSRGKRRERFARRFSSYLDRINFIFPANRILRKLAESTGRKIPIVGVNALPMQVGFDSPSIFANFEEIKGGMAVMGITGKLNVIYEDIFPEKDRKGPEGIIESTFSNPIPLNATMKDTIIVDIEGRPPVEVLIERYNTLRKLSEDEIMNRMTKKKLEVQTPFILTLISKITGGVSLIGLGDYYPINSYPIFFDTSGFDSRVYFSSDPHIGKLKEFISFLKHKESKDSFDFFIMDAGTIPAFGDKILKIIPELKEKSSQWFGIITASPSSFIPDTYKKRNYLTEIEPGIMVTASGSGILMEFMNG